MWLTLTSIDGRYDNAVLINTALVTSIEKNLFKAGTHIVFDAGNYLNVKESLDEIAAMLKEA